MQYNVWGVEFRVESELPKMTSELDNEFRGYPSKGIPPSGFAYANRVDDVTEFIPKHAVIEKSGSHSTVYSLGKQKFIAQTGGEYLVHIPTPDEHKFFCYVRKYSTKFFCTVRNIVKYMIVSLLEDTGIYYIHAAAVSKNGKAAVVFAPSGSGTTRSLFSLMNKDFRLITDDVVLLRESDSMMLPFVIRGNVDEGHVEDFPGLESIVCERGTRLARKRDRWLISMTELFELERGNPKPDVLVRMLRWNAAESSIKEANNEKTLANLMASYREFGSGVYFNSKKTRSDVFSFYSYLLENVRVVDFFVGTDPASFADEFEKLFT